MPLKIVRYGMIEMVVDAAINTTNEFSLGGVKARAIA